MNKNYRQGLLAIAALIFLTGMEPGTADDQVKAEKTGGRPDIYDEQADATADIAAALDRARKENKRVLIQWGANWCGWCHLLHDLFRSDREIARLLNYEYEVVLVDLGKSDKQADLIARYQPDLAGGGLPYLTVLDAEGQVVINQETASLEVREEGVQAHDPQRVLSFLETHQQQPMIAGDVLKQAMENAQQKDRLVFLHFGAPWCGWCHRLEEWMADPQSAVLLEAIFVDCKVDTDRMTGGADLLNKYRGEGGGGIPWFAWIDPQTGQVVADSTGAEGNLGFPWTDEEIAGFGEMLDALGDRCSPQQKAQLLQSLKANREAVEAARAGAN